MNNKIELQTVGEDRFFIQSSFPEAISLKDKDKIFGHIERYHILEYVGKDKDGNKQNMEVTYITFKAETISGSIGGQLVEKDWSPEKPFLVRVPWGLRKELTNQVISAGVPVEIERRGESQNTVWLVTQINSEE